MEIYSAASVNALSSFETGGLPNNFFVDDSAMDREDEHDDGVDSFPMHRKLLRRRHVRKLQKTKERERQRKEEEHKLKELTKDRDRKRRVEKKRALHDNEKASNAKSSAKRSVYSMGINQSGNLIASPVPVLIRKEHFTRGTKNYNNNAVSYGISSPTSVLGLHRMIVSRPTNSPLPPTIDFRPTVSSSTLDMMLMTGSTEYKEIDYRCRSSFSLPEFSPVRPTKFRKLHL